MSRTKKQITFIAISLIGFIYALATYTLGIKAKIFPYNPTNDYIYDFSQTDGIINDLKIKDGRVDLSTSAPMAGQTAFLKIDIDTTFLGRFFQPRIDLIGTDKTLTQYVEHGAHGIRYINLSSLVATEPTDMRLSGKHVSIEDQTAQLVRFKNHVDTASRILILSPHPDDAEIAAYGLYHRHKDTYIITVTAGDAGDHKYNEIHSDRATQFLKKGQLRTWNSITVPLLAGISPEQTVNLGFFDGTLETMYRDKSSNATSLYTNISDIRTYRKQNVSRLSDGLTGESNWNALVRNLEFLMEEIKPDIIAAPYPALDKHIDHKYATIALFEAITGAATMTQGQLYLYTNHFTLNEHYPCGKMHGIASIPPNFGRTPYFDRIYSHPLTLDDQKDKIFALEAMNDLRLDTEWRSTEGTLKMVFRNITRDITGIDYSYYRRAVRSDEVFFVTDIANIYKEAVRRRILGPL